MRANREARIAFSIPRSIRTGENTLPAENETATRTCDNCDVIIAKTEKICPACKTDLEELDENVKAVEAAQKVIEKRKKKTAPPTTAPTGAQPKTSTFTRLRDLRKKG